MNDKLKEILDLAETLPEEAVGSFLKDMLGPRYEAALAYQGALAMLEGDKWMAETTEGKYALMRGALQAIAVRSHTAGVGYALIDTLLRTSFNEVKARELLNEKLNRVITRSIIA